MSRRRTGLAAALSVVVLGQPLVLVSSTALATGAVLLSTQAADAQSAEVFFKRGNAKKKSGDNQGAITDYTKAIETNPQYAAAYYNRGNAKSDLKDYQGAIADYNKAIEINPQYADAYSNLGIAKGIGFNDTKGACSDFRKAASLGNEYRIKYLNSADGAWCRNMR